MTKRYNIIVNPPLSLSLHNQIEIFEIQKATIEIKLNHKEYESLHP